MSFFTISLMIIIAICLVLFSFRLTKFLFTFFFGKYVTISHTNSDGVKQSKKIKIERDNDLIKLLADIKKTANSKPRAHS